MASERDRVQAVVDSALAANLSPVVLEAGCGSEMHVRFPAGSHIVGIDISQAQLERNTNLSERILGDVELHEYPSEEFDAVVCWDVLEHLERPENALERFARAVKQGGIIILSAPNPLSVKGIITKFTPYAFHLWFYRNVRGLKEAGTQSNPPFVTHLRWSMTPRAIRAFARREGFAVLHESVFGYGDSRDVNVIGPKSGSVDAAMGVINFLFRVFSLGRIKPRAAQYYFVLQKTHLMSNTRPTASPSELRQEMK